MGTLPDSITQHPPIEFLASTRQAEKLRNDFALMLVPRKLQEVFHPCFAQSVALRDVFVNSFALLLVSRQLSLLLRFLLAALSMLKLLTTVQLNHCEQNSLQCTKLGLKIAVMHSHQKVSASRRGIIKSGQKLPSVNSYASFI